MIKSGEPITKDDLDDLATAANLRLDPVDMTSTSQDNIGTTYTLTGEFAFKEIADAEVCQWRDEINRIWNSIFAKPDGFGGFIGYDPQTISDSMANYWNVAGAGRRIVASQGPTLMTHGLVGYDGGDPVGVRAFLNSRLYFSKQDFPTFGVGVGPTFGTDKNPYWQAGSGLPTTDAAPAAVSFDYNLDSAFSMDVQIIWEFTKTTSTNVFPDIVHAFFDAGFGSDSSTSASDVWLSPDGNTCYIEDDYGTYDFSPFNYPSGSGAGTLRFWAAVHDGTVGVPTGGWKWTGVRISGQLQTNKIESTEANPSTLPILHPRNATIREVFHVTTAIHLVESDIIDLNSLILKLQNPPADQPSVYIRSRLSVTLREWIDLYPGGIWPTDGLNHDGEILSVLVVELNGIIDSINLYNTGYWNDVSLREATQWLIDIDPDGGEMLQRLNRLLLEDAYPTEIRRVPETSPAPEDEVYELALPETGDDWLIAGSGNISVDLARNWIGTGYLPSVEGIKCIYTARAWPQPFRFNILDHWLPQYIYAYGNNSSYISRMRGQVGDVDPATGNYPYVGFKAVTPAVGNRPSAWPVLRQSDYDANGYGYPVTLPGGTAADTLRNRIDNHHVVNHSGNDFQYADTTLNPLAKLNQLIFIEANTPNQKHEFTCGNKAVGIFVSNVDIPDPTDPATYLWSNPTGTFIFPDDLTAAAIDPSIFYGAELFYSYYNPTGAVQTLHLRRSLFSSSAGEYPPLPEPYFFPRYGSSADGVDTIYNADKPTPNGTIGYVFTPQRIQRDLFGDTYIPATPDKGYSIYEIIIRRPPITNAAGIKVEDTISTSSLYVEIGFMAGTGVISGAITGTFPGIFVTLAAASLFPNTPSARATNFAAGGVPSTEMFIPVLEACPLTYRVTGGDDPGLIINALVDFQPAVNLVFKGTFEQISQLPEYALTGGYDGAPCFPGLFNNGVFSTITAEKILAARNVLEQTKRPVMPPLSAACISDLNDIIAAQPPL